MARSAATVIDGTILTVADAPANTGRYAKQRGNHGGSGYPQLRLSALLACGTRSVLDAVFGPVSTGELDQARHLTRSLRPGMLLLADRNYAAAALIATLAATGADLLIRCKNGRNLPVLRRHRDGSWSSTIGRRCRSGSSTRRSASPPAPAPTPAHYRLITTLLDPSTHPAGELIRLYHERWEIETAYLELKSSILGGRVLRARTPDGIQQEIYALLSVYQLTAHRDARRHRQPTRPRPGPGQLHHRPEHRPRPGRPRRRHHRRHRHRPGRRHRRPRPGRTCCPNAGSASKPA